MSRTNFSDMANFSRRLSSKKKKMEIVKKSKYSSNKYLGPNNKENLLKSQSMQCFGLPATFNENTRTTTCSKIGSRKKLKMNNLALSSGKKEENIFGIVKSSPNFLAGASRDKKCFWKMAWPKMLKEVQFDLFVGIMNKSIVYIK